MSAYLDTVFDEYGRPIEGATVYVYEADGDLAALTSDGVTPIANPILTDDTGIFAFTVADGLYAINVHFGGRVQYKGSIIVGATGDPTAAAAEAAASAATASTAAATSTTNAATATSAASAAAASAAAAAASAEQASEAATGIATTDLLPEGSSNLYHTDARVRGTTLTGLTGTAGTPAAGDTLLVALGKFLKGFFTDHVGAGGSVHANVVAGGAAGFMTGADKTKLDGIATGATANSSNATLLARANHTGTQASSTITMATARFLGRLTAGAGAVEELTAAQVRASLPPIVQTVASSATVTPNATDDLVDITAQATGLTLANPSGTGVDAWGQAIRIKDNGSARTIAFGAKYRAVGVTLPTTTVAGKVLILGTVYNAPVDKWDVVAVRQEA